MLEEGNEVEDFYPNGKDEKWLWAIGRAQEGSRLIEESNLGENGLLSNYGVGSSRNVQQDRWGGNGCEGTSSKLCVS